MRRNRSIRVFGTMLLLFVLATVTYAFTAANTVDTSNAGIGGAAVAGYDVSNITYEFDASDAEQIVGVSFDLDADASSVLVRLNSAGSWLPCTETATAMTWDCDVTVTTLAIENLEVAAAS